MTRYHLRLTTRQRMTRPSLRMQRRYRPERYPPRRIFIARGGRGAVRRSCDGRGLGLGIVGGAGGERGQHEGQRDEERAGAGGGQLDGMAVPARHPPFAIGLRSVIECIPIHQAPNLPTRRQNPRTRISNQFKTKFMHFSHALLPAIVWQVASAAVRWSRKAKPQGQRPCDFSSTDQRIHATRIVPTLKAKLKTFPATVSKFTTS